MDSRGLVKLGKVTTNKINKNWGWPWLFRVIQGLSFLTMKFSAQSRLIYKNWMRLMGDHIYVCVCVYGWPHSRKPYGGVLRET